MEPRIVEIKTSSPERERSREQRFPLIAGPMIWYAMAGLAIILSMYLFLMAEGGDVSARHETAIFIGLWAPMFGILGLRAEIMELRDDLRKRKNKG
jgi:hypothetical protein